MTTIKKRTAYQVGTKLYRTPKAAAKAQAWSMILWKYCNPWVNENGIINLKDVKQIGNLECDCGDDYHSLEVMQYGHECCPLHDRTTGYFAKLHARLARQILADYDAQLASTLPAQTEKG